MGSFVVYDLFCCGVWACYLLIIRIAWVIAVVCGSLSCLVGGWGVGYSGLQVFGDGLFGLVLEVLLVVLVV